MQPEEKSQLCLSSNTLFCHEQLGNFRVYRQRTEIAETLKRTLLRELDNIFISGKIHKPGTRTHAGSVLIGGKTYFIKKYNVRGLWHILANSFRMSRAVRSWLVSWKLIDLDITVPEPLLCVEERRNGLLYRSYLLTEDIADAESLKYAWSKLSNTERTEIVHQLGTMIGRMHHAGCLHGDLKWGNILVSPETGYSKPYLIDFDGARLSKKSLSPVRAKKDLERFLRDLRGVADREYEEQLLDSWRSAFEVQNH